MCGNGYWRNGGVTTSLFMTLIIVLLALLKIGHHEMTKLRSFPEIICKIMGVCLSTRFKKPSLEQIDAANKKWFNDNNDDKCKVSENFDVTTTPRREKVRFSEPLVTFVIVGDRKYSRCRPTSTVFSQIQYLEEMAEKMQF